MTAKNCTIKNSGKQPRKFLYEVAYNLKGEYKSRENGKDTSAYTIWRHMLQRCYDPKIQAKRPTYIGCSVCEEWLEFQNFAKWFYNHEYSDKGFHLDKDILFKNNKIYSPDTCCFVPSKINSLLNDNAAARGEYPQGVYWHKKHEKYRVITNINGKQKHLGYFDCLQEASQSYVEAKEAYVKEKALEWRGRIATNVFDALMEWTVN